MKQAICQHMTVEVHAVHAGAHAWVGGVECQGSMQVLREACERLVSACRYARPCWERTPACPFLPPHAPSYELCRCLLCARPCMRIPMWPAWTSRTTTSTTPRHRLCPDSSRYGVVGGKGCRDGVHKRRRRLCPASSSCGGYGGAGWQVRAGALSRLIKLRLLWRDGLESAGGGGSVPARSSTSPSPPLAEQQDGGAAEPLWE